VDERDDAIAEWLPLINDLARRVPPDHYDDAMIDGMLAVWKGLDIFDGTGNLGGFLHERVRWAIIDGERDRNNYRRRIKRAVLSLEVTGDYSLAAAPLDDPEVRATTAPIFDDVRRHLRPADRDLFDALLSGVSEAEYARREGVTLSRICQRVKAIRATVRRLS